MRQSVFLQNCCAEVKPLKRLFWERSHTPVSFPAVLWSFPMFLIIDFKSSSCCKNIQEYFFLCTQSKLMIQVKCTGFSQPHSISDKCRQK